ncbi:hypothetical protein FNO01nite_04850 [Flavobacterium noncentrifugens]|uniref:Helix-turn-helix domain-containing protein n=1 Tax=Flavobacterium noncentrifugens TaxID=1128970 RepID=A0A1G8SFT9_9FLAO|nr:LexA family transcriptional regulator [Flavobacterium noncentrifugens]GEP49813.1 hypothetical protein FNO01nite_04850 [Flavobacterium noncentrifugens]SDJ28078.1 Helix-turn-helix domain-containing protein [Flavobacterium noncentrifugens]
MTLFSDNIKYLRSSRKESQSKIAEALDIKRSRYEPYESGNAEPPYEILKKMAQYFNISIDLLLSVDIRKYDIEELLTLEDNRILLPIMIDAHGENLIEIVPHKARAGYLTGYADPEFIENLQRISLPFLGSGKYRAFPVEGDSMPPHQDGSYIVGQFTEKLEDIKNGKTYILITKNQGMVYKRLNKNDNNSLMLISDNTLYEPYKAKASEIIEIWEYVCNIGFDDKVQREVNDDSVKAMFSKLMLEIKTRKNG